MTFVNAPQIIDTLAIISDKTLVLQNSEQGHYELAYLFSLWGRSLKTYAVGEREFLALNTWSYFVRARNHSETIVLQIYHISITHFSRDTWEPINLQWQNLPHKGYKPAPNTRPLSSRRSPSNGWYMTDIHSLNRSKKSIPHSTSK